MPHHLLTAAASAVLGAVLVWSGMAAAIPPGVAQAATDVVGDDERDLFIGTGSLLLPVEFSRPGRDTASDCPGCEWKATLACDPVSPTACRGEARLCPDDHQWLRISLARPGQSWQVIGSGCFDPGGPATRGSVEYALGDLMARSVPSLSPRMLPRWGALPHLPVTFSTGQSDRSQVWTWMILGLPVQVTATPTWNWRFDSAGPSTWSSDPGADTPSSAVRHTYTRSGTRSVEVAAVWNATYWVGDLGPLSVAQPVVQTRALSLTVGEARGVLVR